MALETKLFLKMTQQLVMTPQLRQAIKILQISRTELETLIDEQLTENPVLETSLIEPANGTPELTPETPAHDGVVADNTDPAAEKPKEENANDLGQIDWKDYFESYGSEYNGATTNETDSDDERRPAIENTLTRGVTLSDYLEEQVRLAELPDEEKEIAGILIGNIDRDGYLKTTIEEVANFAGVREEKVESVLRKLQEFDPPGVFARDLADCLLIQLKLRGDEDTLAARLIRDHLPFLENRRFDNLAKELGITIEEIVAAARSITTLEPKPGRNFGDGEARYVTPDVTVVKVGDEFVVTLNDDGMPRLRMSQTYLRMLARDGSEEAKGYLQEKMRAATWLIRSIHQRQRTIYLVTKSIVNFQREFFEKGISGLKPLILKDVANDIGMHESTISRATSSKYVHTPQGTFELKFFFTSSLQSSGGGGDVSSERVRQRIRELISAEDPKKPLSDQYLAAMLGREDVDIARRTVAKYREMMGILASSKRKNLY